MARKPAWEDTLVDTNVISGSVASPTMMTGLDRDEARGLTITRLIGRLDFSSATVAGAYGHQIIDVALAVLDRDAIAASALPDPNDADDSPATGWLYRNRIRVMQNGVGANTITTLTFDVRSQRKLNGGQLELILVSTASTGTNFTTDVSGIIRTLVLLP